MATCFLRAQLIVPALLFGLAFAGAAVDGPAALTREKRDALVQQMKDQLHRASSLDEIRIDDRPLDSLLGPASPRRTRWNICASLYEHAAAQTCSDGLRRQVVRKLAEQLADNDELIRQAAMKWLSDFKAADFDQAAKDHIAQVFNQSQSKGLILLSGVAEVTAVYPQIEELASLPLTEPGAGRYYGTATWASLLVTARMGNTESIARLLEAVRAESNRITLATVLFRELEYVRQPEIVQAVANYLSSTDTLPALNEKTQPLGVAWYASQSLGRSLLGFPLNDAFSSQRKWVEEQQEVVFR